VLKATLHSNQPTNQPSLSVFEQNCIAIGELEDEQVRCGCSTSPPASSTAADVLQVALIDVASVQFTLDRIPAATQTDTQSSDARLAGGRRHCQLRYVTDDVRSTTHRQQHTYN